MTATYKTIPSLINNNEPYAHGSSHAERYGSMYRVYSYNTLIYEEDMISGEYSFNERKYSMTTSRLQNIIRKAKDL